MFSTNGVAGINYIDIRYVSYAREEGVSGWRETPVSQGRRWVTKSLTTARSAADESYVGGGAHGGGGGMRMESLHFPDANRKCVMRNPIEMRRETPVLKLKPPGVCSVPLLAPSARWSAPRGSTKKVTQ